MTVVESGAGQPDILEVIADLSNDEVFTPPAVARAILDLLPAEVWSDPKLRWLDPGAKTGVFLREITRRLMVGLADVFPDEQERLAHILQNMVYGVAITELTALMSRRTLYCSKDASGEVSAVEMPTPEGNIWFERIEHSFVSGRCRECGASEAQLGRGEERENYAYGFIHEQGLASIEEAFGMKFDVIVGNPPYQQTDGGGEGASATPLYHYFVDAARSLEPSHIVMVIPARWYSGGKGLDGFRDTMLNDKFVAEIHDYPETDLVFPGVNIRGGVCYFRWSQDHTDVPTVVNYSKRGNPVEQRRSLLIPGASTFVRYNRAISILEKVRAQGEPTYESRVHPRNVFGIPANFAGYSSRPSPANSVVLFRSRRGVQDDKRVYVSPSTVVSNKDYVDRPKVLVSKASPGGDEYPHAVFSTPLFAPAGMKCP